MIVQDEAYPQRTYPQRTNRTYPSASSLESGRRYLKRGDYERATDVLLKAVLADPEAGLPKLLFAHALFASGDYDYAAYAVRRAIVRMANLDADSPTVEDLYSDSDEFGRLVYKLHDHLKQRPSDENAHFLLGYMNYFAGHDDDAIRSFNAALRFDPRDAHATELRKLARARLRATTQKYESHPPRRWIPEDKIKK